MYGIIIAVQLWIQVEDMRGINFNDFVSAFKQIRSSVGQNELQAYIEWNNIYGSSRIEDEENGMIES